MSDSGTLYEFGPFRLELAERRLLRQGAPVALTPKSFDLLSLLVRNSGHLLTKDELMHGLWPDSSVEENNLTVYVSALRRALGESKSAGVRYIETVPRNGYRFTAAVRHTDARPDAPEGRRAGGAAGPPAIKAVAVFPLVNAGGDEELDYIADGITERVTNRLSRLPRLRVIAHSTVLRLKDMEQLDACEVGRRLQVDAFLTGRMLKVRRRLVISAELVSVADGVQIWGERYTCKLSDVSGVEEQLAREVSEHLRLELTREESVPLAPQRAGHFEAYHLYLKGRYFWNRRNEAGARKAVELFGRSAEVDPDYALAYAGLADAYHSLCGVGAVAPKEGYPLAKAAALKALELDEGLAEAHATLGLLSLRYEWDWQNAEKELKRALALNPNYAAARNWYSLYLTARGRHDEAIEECRQALRLDPLSLIVNTILGVHYLAARRYDQAIAQLLATLELDPDFMYARAGLGECYMRKGRFEESVAEAERACRVAGWDASPSLTCRGFVYAFTGRVGEARRLLEELLERAAGPEYVAGYEVARIYVALGDHDSAFEWLERAYEQRDGNMIHLNVLPDFDPLRDDPRFKTLVRRMNLVPAERGDANENKGGPAALFPSPSA